MVRVTVIGVNGNAGSEIASELLRRGHQVTGIARDPSKVKEQKGLTVVKGDVFTDDLASLLKGAEVVVSAYGPGIEVVGPLITLTFRLIKAVAANQRLIVVGGAGGLTMPDGSLTINQSWFPSNIKPIAQAHIDALEILRFYSDAINWTTLSPAGIFFVGERLGHYRTGIENLVANDKGESKISYADYAIALVDEIEKPKHERKRFSVGY